MRYFIIVLFIALFLLDCGGSSRKKPAPGPVPETVSPEAKAEEFVQEGIRNFKDQQFPRAVKNWQNALKLIPEDSEVHNFLGIGYHRLGLLDSAIAEYKLAINLKNDYYQAYNNLGYIYFLKGQYPIALKNFQKALDIRPDYAQARLNYEKCREIMAGRLPLKAFELVETASRLDSLPQKIAIYRRALVVDSNYADAWNNLAVAYYYYGNPDSAVFCLKKALNKNPDHPEVLNNIGFILDDNGDYKSAIAYYQKAIRIKPDYVVAMGNLGDAYLHIGDMRSARIILEHALQLQPDDIWLQRKLSRLKTPAQNQNVKSKGEK